MIRFRIGCFWLVFWFGFLCVVGCLVGVLTRGVGFCGFLKLVVLWSKGPPSVPLGTGGVFGSYKTVISRPKIYIIS